jgi:uncharacterized protein
MRTRQTQVEETVEGRSRVPAAPCVQRTHDSNADETSGPESHGGSYGVPEPSGEDDHGCTARCTRLILLSFLLVAVEGCSSPQMRTTDAAHGPDPDKGVATSRQSSRSPARRGVDANTSTKPVPSPAKPGSPTIEHNITRVASTDGPPWAVLAADPRLPPRKHHANDVGLVSDEGNGTFARIAADLHTELGRDRLRIRPSGSSGPLRTLNEILYRPGADIGVVQADALESLVMEDPSTVAPRHLRFLSRIYDAHVHVVTRDMITDIRQLDSLAVNIGSPDSGSHLTARLVFGKLGIKPTFTTYDTGDALDRLRAGEITAVFVVAPRPAAEILQFFGDGFHLLAVPWDPEVLRSYNPSEFLAADYPTLIREGERVETIAVDVVLAVYNWRESSTGYRRLTRFTRSLFSRLNQLQQPGHHFSWSQVDPSAEVHGWQRFTFEGGPRPVLPQADNQQRPFDPDRRADGG